MRLKVYTDTSVIGGCFDPEFSEWSNALLELSRNGHIILLISDLTLRELETAPDEVKNIVDTVPDLFVERVELSGEAEVLAKEYISAGVVSKTVIADALHIAIATVSLADILVSWNFKHIVNYRKIRGFNGVNLLNGYRELDIRTPREVIHVEDF
jgi:predicted nucleic acid-binding protein